MRTEARTCTKVEVKPFSPRKHVCPGNDTPAEQDGSNDGVPCRRGRCAGRLHRGGHRRTPPGRAGRAAAAPRRPGGHRLGDHHRAAGRRRGAARRDRRLHRAGPGPGHRHHRLRLPGLAGGGRGLGAGRRPPLGAAGGPADRPRPEALRRDPGGRAHRGVGRADRGTEEILQPPAGARAWPAAGSPCRSTASRRPSSSRRCGRAAPRWSRCRSTGGRCRPDVAPVRRLVDQVVGRPGRRGHLHQRAGGAGVPGDRRPGRGPGAGPVPLRHDGRLRRPGHRRPADRTRRAGGDAGTVPAGRADPRRHRRAPRRGLRSSGWPAPRWRCAGTPC